MSAIQEVSENVEKFQAKVKEAKEAQHLTIEQLSERSGVPFSVIGRISSGAHPDPKLTNAAALALSLGLSLDELCGLVPPVPADETLLARVRELELENVAHETQVAELRTRIKAIHPLVYGLCVLCITLAMALAVYLLGDSQYPEIGLIRWGEITGPAWALIGVIIASVVVTVLLVWQVTHPRRKKNG